MQIDWTDLATAFALYLVLEGVMPFMNPGAMKRALGLLSQMPDAQLRIAGLASMLAGLVLVWLIRS